uniref:Uncharacterized protein n=1 Tax=Arundo donax TaxID=35708 RepID=A0A0A9DZJ2_ARUDO
MDVISLLPTSKRTYTISIICIESEFASFFFLIGARRLQVAPDPGVR